MREPPRGIPCSRSARSSAPSFGGSPRGREPTRWCLARSGRRCSRQSRGPPNVAIPSSLRVCAAARSQRIFTEDRLASGGRMVHHSIAVVITSCLTNFVERRLPELRRIPLPRTRVNRGPWAHLRPLSILAVRRSVGEVDDARLECLRVHELQRFRVAPFLKEALAASHYNGMDHEPQFV